MPRTIAGYSLKACADKIGITPYYATLLIDSLRNELATASGGAEPPEQSYA